MVLPFPEPDLLAVGEARVGVGLAVDAADGRLLEAAAAGAELKEGRAQSGARDRTKGST